MARNKSYEDFLLGLYRTMFSDIVEFDPSLQKECERDYKRLLSAVEEHGIHFLVDTLPAFAKHFDQCLAKQCLTPSGLCHFGPFRRGRAIPRLFKGLLRRIFDDFGVLKSDFDVQAIRFVRQLCLTAKRLRIPCDPHATWRQVDEFIKTDGEVAPGSLNWDTGDFDSSRAHDLHLGDHVRDHNESEPELPGIAGKPDDLPISRSGERRVLDSIQRVADIFSSQIGGFDPALWKFRHGPGAVADARSGVYKYVFPNWPAKLETVFSASDYASHNYDAFLRTYSNEGKFSGSLMNHEPPARLLAVPKSYSGPRLIASEPLSHQWCQQSIRDFLVSRTNNTILHGFISYEHQEYNARLALEASRDGELATIDLSSASDRVSCWVVERIFRNNPTLLDAFYAVRTRWLRQKIDRESPEFIRIRKFSTMGSALTFPVQSIVFLSIAVGCELYARNLRPTLANIRKLYGIVRVFGDDIIVSRAASGLTVDLLHYLGFKVNVHKTFVTGLFRESCGMEAFAGHDVTRVSLLTVPSVAKPESILSTIDVHNNYLQRGWLKSAQYLKRAVTRLGRFFFPDVALGSGAIGWYSFVPSLPRGTKSRWNEKIHKAEFRVTMPRGSVTKAPVDSEAMLLQYFTEVTRPPISHETRLGESALRHPVRLGWVWASADSIR